MPDEMDVMAARLDEAANEAADMMKALSNPGRLRILCTLVPGERTVGEIEEAVGESQSYVSGQLLKLRAEGLVHGLDPAAARARLSGLLIGAELAAARPYWLGQRVALLGDSRLAGHYAAALAAQAAPPETAEAEAMTLAGLTAARHALFP